MTLLSATIRPGRPDDAAAIARCHIAAWRDTYRPIVAEEFLNSLSLADHTAKWNKNFEQPECPVFVAHDEQAELIGFVFGGRERTARDDFQGEIYSMYLLKECRGQGVGRALFDRFAEALLAMGIDSLIVWALEGNEYRHCYAAWGGEEITTQPIQIGSQNLLEVAYGWRDLKRR